MRVCVPDRDECTDQTACRDCPHPVMLRRWEQHEPAPADATVAELALHWIVYGDLFLTAGQEKPDQRTA